MGIELLVDSGLMEFVIPEFLDLRGCEQPPQFHPEGDVYVHTLMMLELLGDNSSLELALSVRGSAIEASVNGASVVTAHDGEFKAGFAAMAGGWHRALFSSVAVDPLN